MNSRFRSPLLTTAGLIFVGCILRSVAIPHASVETSNDEDLPQLFTRQLKAIPNTFEAQDSASLSRTNSAQAVDMKRHNDSVNLRRNRKEADEVRDDTSDADMEELLKMELGEYYDSDDEGDIIDNQEVDYAGRMGFAEGDDADDEYEVDENPENFDESFRLKSDMHHEGKGADSTVVASGSFAGVQNVRVIYPGDVFNGIFENTTYRRGGRRGEVIFEYVEVDEDDEDDDDELDGDDGEELDIDDEEDEGGEEEIEGIAHEENDEEYSNYEDD